MNAKKAFRKFGDACLNAPPEATLRVGLCWIETKGWRVLMAVGAAYLMVGPKDARALADIYDKHHLSPEWRNKKTGLEWIAGELRTLATEADAKILAGVLPPEILEHVVPQGHS
jgi:hypothetical protein